MDTKKHVCRLLLSLFSHGRPWSDLCQRITLEARCWGTGEAEVAGPTLFWQMLFKEEGCGNLV